MPTSSPSRLALLIIDMINALDCPGGASLLRHALPASARIARLKARCRRAGVPAVHANDNDGQWRSDFRDVVAVRGHQDALGAPLAAALPPGQADLVRAQAHASGVFPDSAGGPAPRPGRDATDQTDMSPPR